MRRVLTAIFVLVAAVAMAQDHYWENPEMFAENKLPARATLMPYPSAEEAFARGESSLVMDISGEWRFHWSATPAEAPEGFWAVPVETGIADDYFVEIKSGVEADTVVFTQMMTTEVWM